MAYTVKVGVQRLDLTDRPSLTPMQVWKSGRCIWILQATSPQVLLNKNYSSTCFLEKFISTEFVKNILKYITSGHLWALPKIVYIFNIFFLELDGHCWLVLVLSKVSSQPCIPNQIPFLREETTAQIVSVKIKGNFYTGYRGHRFQQYLLTPFETRGHVGK